MSARPLPFDVVVFDLDGTLLDTAEDLAAALNHALTALGRPAVPVESVRGLIGHGGRALLRKGLAATGEASDALVEEHYPVLLDHYARHICDATRPYPGLEEALDAIAAAGAEVAVCTNKAEGLTRALFDALGWRNRFAAIVGGDTLPFRKPDPAPLREAVARAGGGRAVLVGDSITDADTARAAGVPFVAVSFGFRDRPLDALGADVAIDRYDDLMNALYALAEEVGR
ncbi:MAG: phosphoglycolate phosphatase [Alphaproteobacteria bacterium]|nr:phosphoglycolate phosphatase [Alphaproteobacteria bacterium]